MLALRGTLMATDLASIKSLLQRHDDELVAVFRGTIPIALLDKVQRIREVGQAALEWIYAHKEK